MFFPQTGHVIFLFTDVYKLFIISPHALHSRTYVAWKKKKKKKKAKAETKKQENHMTCVEENMHAKKS